MIKLKSHKSLVTVIAFLLSLSLINLDSALSRSHALEIEMNESSETLLSRGRGGRSRGGRKSKWKFSKS